MKIPSTNNLTQTVRIQSSSGAQLNLQQGQLVQARVVGQLADNLVQLRVGATILTAQINAAVRINDTLNLEVVSNGRQPVLQGVNQASLEQLVQNALRQTLPQQQSHAQLIDNLNSIIKSKLLETLPPAVQQAIKNLVQNLPDQQLLRTAEGIRRAFQNSGLYLEARLANPNTQNLNNLPNDFKAGLLRLQQAIQGQLQNLQPALTQKLNTSTTYAFNNTTTNPVNTATQALLNRHVNQAAIFHNIHTARARPLAVNTLQISQQALQAGSPSNLNISTALNNVINSQVSQNLTQLAASTTPVQSNTVAPSSAGLPLNPDTIARQNTIPVGSTIMINKGHTQQLIPGLPLLASNLAAATATGLTGRTDAPYIYAGTTPFRIQHEQQLTRPSARFNKLDSLAKILTFFLKDTESSLARIQMNQLNQHVPEQESKQGWVFEIPVKRGDNIDLFEFRIQQDSEKNQEDEDEKQAWDVQIAFTIEELGQMYSRIRMYKQQVTITFWHEDQDTINTFQQYAQTLQQELEDAGLIINQISCLQGQPQDFGQPDRDRNMLDEQV